MTSIKTTSGHLDCDKCSFRLTSFNKSNNLVSITGSLLPVSKVTKQFQPRMVILD